MRNLSLVLLVLVVSTLVAAPALAQAPDNGSQPTMCNRGFGGGGGGAPGQGGQGYRGPGGGNGFPELNITVDPASSPSSPLTIAQGASMDLTATLRNDGQNGTLDVGLLSGGFGRRGGNGGGPPPTPALNVTVDPTNLSIAQRASQQATLHVTVSADAPTDCISTTFVLVRDDATNETARIRIDVMATPSGTATPATATPASETPKKSPLPLLAPLVGLALAALIRRR